MGASGQGGAVIPEEYRSFVMNTRNGAVTEFQNFNFNSYAKIGSKYYGAGPTGLYELEGDRDDATNISWSFRTGQLDDKNPALKRLPEILMALRQTGPVRVRVWSDDDTYNDYVLPPTNTATIHQARVIPGKGLRSRYYAVELQGISNSAIELSSLQLNFTKTTRRLG